MMRDLNITRLFGVVLLAAALVGVGAVMEAAAPSPREAIYRYVIAALIVLAVAPAHVLLPDPLIPWLQRLNPVPVALLRRAAGRWAGIAAATLLPIAVIGASTGDPAGVVEGSLLLVGVALYAFQDVMGLGPVSQEWQEGRRGQVYRQMVARNPRASFQVPHGMIPAMLASGRVFLVGFGFMVATVFLLALAGPAVAWLGGAALLGWSSIRLVRLAGVFDRAYYQTSALYAELLHSPAAQLGARPGITYDAVYWVPRRWRAHAWAGLVQLDRRLPLGRLFALGAIGFFVLMIFGVAQAAVGVYIAVGLLVRNATIIRFSRPDVAPPGFHLALQSRADWLATRFFMNVRWTLPLALALGIAAIFSGWFTWGMVLFWVGIDLLLALLTAALATYAAEQRYRNRFA